MTSYKIAEKKREIIRLNWSLTASRIHISQRMEISLKVTSPLTYSRLQRQRQKKQLEGLRKRKVALPERAQTTFSCV